MSDPGREEAPGWFVSAGLLRPLVVTAAIWVQVVAVVAFVLQLVAEEVIAQQSPSTTRFADVRGLAGGGRVFYLVVLVSLWGALLYGVYRGVRAVRLVLTVIGVIFVINRWVESSWVRDMRFFPELGVLVGFEIVLSIAVAVSIICLYLRPATRFFHSSPR